MVKAEQIPDKVVGTYEEAYWRNEMTVAEALAAAINAWPNLFVYQYGDGSHSVILPLHPEKETSA